MSGVASWFTADRRQQIQVFFGSLAPLVILLGFASEDQVEQYLIIIGAVLQFVSSLLSLVNVRKGDFGAAWAVVRGAVFGLATVVSPALVLLGYFSPETNAALLTALSLGLSALSSLLAIFTSSAQQKEALVQKVAEVTELNASDLRADLKAQTNSTVLPDAPGAN